MAIIHKAKTIALMGDLHEPFSHKQNKLQFYEFIKQTKPDVIIQIGDLYDMFSQSRFPRKLIITPEDEREQGRESAEQFWYQVKKASKNSKCIQLKGNHCDRAEKRQIEKCPENMPFFSVKAHFTFDGVETIHDSRDRLVVGGIDITHGHRKYGTHMLEVNNSTITGHTHRAGVIIQAYSPSQIIWELNVGYGANPYHEALKYCPKEYNSWTLGFGYVDEYGPRAILHDGKKR